MYLLLCMAALAANGFQKSNKIQPLSIHPKKIVILTGEKREEWAKELSQSRRYAEVYPVFQPGQIYPYPVGWLMEQAGDQIGFLSMTDSDTQAFANILGELCVLVSCEQEPSRLALRKIRKAATI